MNPSGSSFSLRDAFLKRQPHIRKQHLNLGLHPLSSLKSRHLHIIQEEDESRTSSSSSRSPSPSNASSVSPGGNKSLGLKARRRHASVSVSDIRVAKTAPVHYANEISEQYPTLLSTPRPAPRPPATPSPSHSPVPSPDPFHLTFTDTSFLFPHPPIQTPCRSSDSRLGSESPTPSMSTSDTSTSPDSQSSGLPDTPSSSDDEFPSYYSSAWPSFNARRASIKPLVINKINPPTIAEDSDDSIAPSLRQPFKNSEEHQLLSPSSDDSEPSSDDESDSEWYTRQFSKILTLSSPIPPSFPQQSRPESIFVHSATAPGSPKAAVDRYPTAQLDPAFPRRRRSRTSIPTYPPPPVPATSTHIHSPPTKTSPQIRPRTRTKTRSSALSLRRPPPRSSIPADCVFADTNASYYAFSDDSASAFSLSMYDSLSTPTSPNSMYSQSSPSPFLASFPSTPSSFPKSATSEEFEFDDVDLQFDMDIEVDSDNQTMILPSLPCSPIDLEADIASGLEELRLRNPLQMDDVFSDTASSAGADEPQRGLRSKWSSSTLSSIREEHQRRSASAKLRAYFNTSINSPSKSKFRSSSSSRKLTTPATPTTPLPSPSTKRFKHPRREMYAYAHTKDLHSYLGAKPADVVIMGYEQTQGLRRRGSLSASVSDAGSDDSTSTSGSGGLRRKPIPVEMFLRSAA